MARKRLLSSANVFYVVAALISIAILLPPAICFTVLTFVIASPLILVFSPILLATCLVFAAFTIVGAAGMALWWLVPSFRKKVNAGLGLVRCLMSEAWKRGKEALDLFRVSRATWGIISGIGRRTKGIPPFSWVSRAVKANFEESICGDGWRTKGIPPFSWVLKTVKANLDGAISGDGQRTKGIPPFSWVSKTVKANLDGAISGDGQRTEGILPFSWVSKTVKTTLDGDISGDGQRTKGIPPFSWVSRDVKADLDEAISGGKANSDEARMG